MKYFKQAAKKKNKTKIEKMNMQKKLNLIVNNKLTNYIVWNGDDEKHEEKTQAENKNKFNAYK